MPLAAGWKLLARAAAAFIVVAHQTALAVHCVGTLFSPDAGGLAQTSYFQSVKEWRLWVLSSALV
jgi:hypothetical protein